MSPIEEKPDKSFFSSLLNSSTIETDTNSAKMDKKKPHKLSQKERKRMSVESENPKPKVETVTTPKAIWVGWGSGSNSQMSSSPSLADIMKMERKSPPETKLPKTPSSENLRPKKVSESEKKPEKKTSWRKIDLSTSIEKPKIINTPSPTKTSNPWNIPTSSSSNNSASFSSFESPMKTLNESFEKIMKEDEKKEENLYKAQSKPLYVTQIEEQAIEELKTFYNANNTTEENLYKAQSK